MSSSAPQPTETQDYPSYGASPILNGSTILYVTTTIIGTVLATFLALCMWRWRRNRRMRRMGLDPWTGMPSVFIPVNAKRPEFYDVWLDVPEKECTWGDMKPFSLEQIDAMTHHSKCEKPSSRFSRFSVFSNKSLETLVDAKDVEAGQGLSSNGAGPVRERPIPPSLQLSVFIAMPTPHRSAKAREGGEGAGEGDMTVGLVTVPYSGPIPEIQKEE